MPLRNLPGRVRSLRIAGLINQVAQIKRTNQILLETEPGFGLNLPLRDSGQNQAFLRGIESISDPVERIELQTILATLGQPVTADKVKAHKRAEELVNLGFGVVILLPFVKRKR